MRPFEYARPTTEAEAVELLRCSDGEAVVLAGGTDLISLLQRDVLRPKRVVDIKGVDSLRGIQPTADGVVVGVLTTLEELADSPLLKSYRSLHHVNDGIRAIQVQQNGTVGGDLCHLPNCWYFRNGYGLLALQDGASLVEEGDNRYHAILGNRGPAKFVSASRFAPPLIAWQARVRVVGPEPGQEEWLPLEYFYQTPKSERQGVTVLKPGQLLTHIWLPARPAVRSAAYEVLETQGLDWPLAAAAACLELDESGLVRTARVVLGHVAPVPWVAREAAEVLRGRPVTFETAQAAADRAVAGATPLSQNEYKVQLARAAVKRALLRAVDLWQEGV